MPNEDEQVPVDLDEVHENEIESLDEDDDTVDDDVDDDADDASDDAADDADEDDEDAEDEGEEDIEVPEEKELDTDITKAGEGKVAFKGYDGTTYYVNNEDELPDDFEPASYKDFAKALRELDKVSRQRDEEDLKRQKAEAQKQNSERVKKINESWDEDITQLTEAGYIPSGDEGTKVVDNVFAFMEKELNDAAKKGKPIPSSSFATAFVKYQKEERKKQDAEDKKRRGGRVRGNADTSSEGSKPSKPLAYTGGGLDAVHEEVMGDL